MMSCFFLLFFLLWGFALCASESEVSITFYDSDNSPISEETVDKWMETPRKRSPRRREDVRRKPRKKVTGCSDMEDPKLLEKLQNKVVRWREEMTSNYQYKIELDQEELDEGRREREKNLMNLTFFSGKEKKTIREESRTTEEMRKKPHRCGSKSPDIKEECDKGSIDNEDPIDSGVAAGNKDSVDDGCRLNFLYKLCCFCKS